MAAGSNMKSTNFQRVSEITPSSAALECFESFDNQGFSEMAQTQNKFMAGQQRNIARGKSSNNATSVKKKRKTIKQQYTNDELYNMTYEGIKKREPPKKN